ncbi:MAG TPA: sugar ABC transporter substrate-binding protein [Pseudonocardia sp.]|jgi:hypothetical protein
MVAPHPVPDDVTSASGSAPGSVLPWTTSFLPLTLSAIRDRPELWPLEAAARRAEAAAAESWHVLLGGCTCSRHLAERLRRLSTTAAEHLDAPRWHGGHRARVDAFERWAAEALVEGDGAEFAEAFAGYDAALAHALATVPARR